MTPTLFSDPAKPPFRDVAEGIAALRLSWLDEQVNLTGQLLDIARSSADTYTAECAIQQLLYRAGSSFPISEAARFIDGPLGPLVGTHVRQENAS